MSVHPVVRRAYGLATAWLLASHFGGWRPGLAGATALTMVQVVHFGALSRTWRALDVQVRGPYMMLLVLGLPAPMSWIHAVQLAGVSALLAADYCPAARLLILMPWNRVVPLNPGFIRWAVLPPPAPGSIADRQPRQPRVVEREPRGSADDRDFQSAAESPPCAPSPACSPCASPLPHGRHQAMQCGASSSTRQASRTSTT